jgi:hypothetical protein
MTDDNVAASLVDRLNARAAEKKDFHDHMDRISNVQAILAKAIQAMRDAGATENEIVGVLAHAANELAQ